MNPARTGVPFLPDCLANDTRVQGDTHDSQGTDWGKDKGNIRAENQFIAEFFGLAI